MDEKISSISSKKEFIELGGLPEEKHPLSFVIEGSDYLRDWFGNGIESRLRLSDIQPCHISFTIGDSGAEKEKHPFMTMDTSVFWEWSLDEMVAWEKGVISEQTPYILNDLNELSKEYDMILFEGMLDLEMVSIVVPDNQIVYLSVDKSVCEREFFARETHRGMIDNILSTPGISDEEKQRRIMMRKGATINAFYENAKEFGIQTFIRDVTTTVQEMAEKVEKHFGLAK